MSKLISNRLEFCNVICAVLLAVLLVFQFVPFWNIGEETENVSIGSYIWFPEDHKDVKSYLSEQTGEDCSADNLLAMPMIVLFAGIAGIILGFVKRESILGSLVAALVGGAGMWGYLAKPAFQLGANWQLHLAISALVLIAAVIGIVFGVKEIKEQHA